MANLALVLVVFYLLPFFVPVLSSDFDPLLDVEQNYDRNVSCVLDDCFISVLILTLSIERRSYIVWYIIFFLQITTTINPNCPQNECVNFTLIHVQQQGRTDVLHHLWTMENIPTFFYARTEINTELIIDWHKMLSGNNSQAISFSKEPQYFAAVLILKVGLH